MPSFNSHGVSLAYDDLAPAGPAERTVVLVHGFASNRLEAWRRTGWYAAFQSRGMRVIALDLRGHGESGKPHGVEDYGREILARDVIGLMDHLELGRVDLFGYSMGAHTSLSVALQAPDRLSNLILGGIGERLLAPRDPARRGSLAQAMLADDPEAIEDRMARGFRQFAELQGEDREALAAFSQAHSPAFDRDAMAALPMPVLVVAGVADAAAGDPAGLASLFPYGQAVSVPGCDHFSAIPHALTKAAVFDFLDGLLDDPFPPSF
jgi:pimeloyl-ACP methyl ester carboxylesterase